MATCASPLPENTTNDSDYGSDIDSELAIQVLSQLEAAPQAPLALESLEDDAPCAAPARLPAQLSTHPLRRTLPVEIGYSPSPRNLAHGQGATGQFLSAEPEQHDSNATDNRSPLERFRTLPKKPLSVTDIVSPAWCELQYWYTLTKHGRKRQTPAMKQGSRVHKELEDQVHTTVQVIVRSKEEAWALKIWNVIQGLRTLRNTGFTRELEVWGVIDGQVVNGIIDQLSYDCPDEALEELAIARLNRLNAQLPTQPSIPQSVKAQAANDLQLESSLSEPHPQRKVWITDVKTRGSKTLPQGSSMRPTLMQLMLYRKLLADLATNQVDAEVIFSRYRLKWTEEFTNTFVAEIGGLDLNPAEEPPDDEELSNSQLDGVSELFAHNSLIKLWGLMVQEFGKAIAGSGAIGQVLRAEFRQAKTGVVLGSKSLVYDAGALNKYLEDEMKWWRGERSAKGVDIEEAFKCRICEFAEGCEWREGKIQEATENHRKKRSSSRSKSLV